ncbi:MAG TPA: hypothetical protein VGP76_28345 [Planctomycetaceae bacterium]|jgi:hypothetical protein|nr:hypothetical protein [Planctomycetaceae bacterium]
MSFVASSTPPNFGRPSEFPKLPWHRVYLTALVIFAAIIGSLEAYGRIRGIVPSAPDSADLWAYHRSFVVGNDPKLVVAIGTSRIRTDLRSDVLRQCLPSHRFVQLGINGATSSLGLLAEISRIPGFSGIVLCDILPPLMAPEHDNDQVSFARRSVRKADALSTYLHGVLCERLVVLNADLTLRQCMSAQDGPRSNKDGRRHHTHADRTLDIDYTSPEGLKAATESRLRTYAEMYARERRYKSIDEFKLAIAGVADSVARIRRNGGQVVFLRLPASGARLELEESAFPSSVYFGALASVTAAPWIDFRDLSRDGDLDCPDESHLSLQAARIFTIRLVERLRLSALL